MTPDPATSFGVVDRQLLKLLFRTDDQGIELYTLHSEYQYSPAQVVRSLRRLQAAGVLEITGTRIRFCVGGRQWVIGHRKALFAKGETPWKRIPEWMLRNENGDFRLPKVRELGSEFLRDFGKR